jgi:hypothetical protein
MASFTLRLSGGSGEEKDAFSSGNRTVQLVCQNNNLKLWLL